MLFFGILTLQLSGSPIIWGRARSMPAGGCIITCKSLMQALCILLIVYVPSGRGKKNEAGPLSWWEIDIFWPANQRHSQKKITTVLVFKEGGHSYVVFRRFSLACLMSMDFTLHLFKHPNYKGFRTIAPLLGMRYPWPWDLSTIYFQLIRKWPGNLCVIPCGAWCANHLTYTLVLGRKTRLQRNINIISRNREFLYAEQNKLHQPISVWNCSSRMESVHSVYNTCKSTGK